MLATTDLDLVYMREALRLAGTAAARGDVPVGAIVVMNGAIIGVGFNTREAAADPTGHAEIVALREACRREGRWRVDGATLYVTLEPCPMCACALVWAKLPRLVFGAFDERAGACGTLYNIPDDPRLTWRIEVVSGVEADRASGLLRTFFRQRRADSSAGPPAGDGL